MLPQGYKYKFVKYYVLQQNDFHKMKFCLEAWVNVLNLTTNVKQFMAELNHNTGCTFNTKSHRTKCSNFSHLQSISFGPLVLGPINPSWSAAPTPGLQSPLLRLLQ